MGRAAAAGWVCGWHVAAVELAASWFTGRRGVVWRDILSLWSRHEPSSGNRLQTRLRRY